jgi:adenosylmethionine-8-amino-7-oxononanoate aminotransferase
VHARIKRHAMDRGLICYPAGGTADGAKSDHVLLAPPFIIGDTEITELVEKLGAAIDAALADARGR